MSDDESKELKAGHPPAGNYYFIFNISANYQKIKINKRLMNKLK